MNTAPRLGFQASLDSQHLRNSHSGALPTVKNRELLQESETPSLRYEGEGVTLCQACNGHSYIRLDEHHFEACPFC